MGIEPYLVSSSISAVLAQRLVRVLCRNCRIKDEDPDKPTRELTERFKISGAIYKPSGCPKCNLTGFSGRTAINELVILSPELQDMANQKAPHAELRRRALKEGMISLRSDGMSKVSEGITTIEEVLRVSHDDDYSLYGKDLENIRLLEQVGG
jgi:type II secretory ATPase GspE/PulE/Tfp pilus assembly ATPase PilB-like protein